MNTTETLPKPKLSDADACWPPVAHIAKKKQGTVKEGDIALCGERLMGINLDEAHVICKRCLEIFQREVSE